MVSEWRAPRPKGDALFSATPVQILAFNSGCHVIFQMCYQASVFPIPSTAKNFKDHLRAALTMGTSRAQHERNPRPSRRRGFPHRRREPLYARKRTFSCDFNHPDITRTKRWKQPCQCKMQAWITKHNGTVAEIFQRSPPRSADNGNHSSAARMYYLLPTTYYLLPTSYFLLPTSHFLLLLLTSYFLLPTSYFLFATCYLLLATCFLLLATCYLLLATSY